MMTLGEKLPAWFKTVPYEINEVGSSDADEYDGLDDDEFCHCDDDDHKSAGSIVVIKALNDWSETGN